ncbi:MAG: response regulator [Desulfobacterales bacterium]|jgi:DNA-binding NtrC family response regulator
MGQIESIPKGNETILLIDDEESVRVGIEFMLVKIGYTVHSAEDGREALEIFREHWRQIDLIILDLVMPGMLGAEVFDQLRAIDPSCKVLLSSGYSTSEEAQELLGRGCAGFLQKPFNIERLSFRIREILGPPAGGR